MNPAIDFPAVAVFVFLAIGAIALFTFLSVATWSGTRFAEREAYYKADMLKKIAEMGGERNQALEYLREEERIKAARKIAVVKLGGLINVGIGLGLMIFLKALVPWKPIYLVGTIELFIGMALLVYAFWLAPKPETRP
jgi:hypothetical protein